jgi:hypothetical protein
MFEFDVLLTALADSGDGEEILNGSHPVVTLWAAAMGSVTRLL